MSAVHAVVTTTPQHNIATKAVSHHESLQSCVNELFKLPNVGWEPGHFLSAPRPDDPYGEIPLDRFILDRLLVPTNLPSVTIAQKCQAEIEKCKDDVLKEPPNGSNAQHGDLSALSNFLLFIWRDYLEKNHVFALFIDNH